MAKKSDNKIGAKHYPYEFKVEVLKTLEANNFNYIKTSRDTKIDQATIKKWKLSMGYKVYAKPPDVLPINYASEMLKAFEDRRAKFVEKCFDSKEIAVDKLTEVIKKETKLSPNLIQAIIVLHNITDGKAIDPSDNAKAQVNTFFSNITFNKLTVNENSSDRLQGNNPESTG